MPRSTASIAYFTASGAFAMIFRAIASAVASKFRRFSDVIHQADAQRLFGRDHFARKNQLVRDSLAAQPRQPLRSAVSGKNAEFHFRLAQSCVAARNAHRAGKRQFAAAAQCESVDRRNRRLSQRFEPVKNFLP